MGDLAFDTDVVGRHGFYRARLSPDWEIWGPCGGYVAAVMLRAAAAHSALPRPATLACHFLGVAAFDDVTLEVTSLRTTSRTESVRVSMRQEDRPIAEAIVWCVADELDGPETTWATMPVVSDPAETPRIEDLVVDSQPRPHAFWQNLEYRPLTWLSPDEWATRVDTAAVFQRVVPLHPDVGVRRPLSGGGASRDAGRHLGVARARAARSHPRKKRDGSRRTSISR